MDENRLAERFKALGDPTRLKIIGCLGCCDLEIDDGTSVTDICCFLYGTEQIPSKISFHLKELKNAGLVAVRKEGRRSIYCLNRDAIAELSAALKLVECNEGECK